MVVDKFKTDARNSFDFLRWRVGKRGTVYVGKMDKLTSSTSLSVGHICGECDSLLGRWSRHRAGRPQANHLTECAYFLGDRLLWWL